ncbi:MAG: hypothetical protein JSW40_06475 [Candidatus Omnitrophota bacterium]|nr:MAG: hypothetical protein JSW40_06475 [Candidatus Omnitrophota bacterium]
MEQERKILNYFHLLKRNERMGTSYLFIGDNPLLAKEIVKLILCEEDDFFCGQCWDCQRIEDDTHPDVFTVQPEPNFIKIERIRDAQQFLSLKAFRSKRKILIIKGGVLLTAEAANAFLKTLEEPPQNSFIAIHSSQLEGILPTIASRCRKIFLPLQEKTVDMPTVSVASFIKGERVKFNNRKEFALFLQTLLVMFHTYLMQKLTKQKGLYQKRENALIEKTYTVEELEDIVKGIMDVYSAYNTINENLALNLIRMRL